MFAQPRSLALELQHRPFSSSSLSTDSVRVVVIHCQWRIWIVSQRLLGLDTRIGCLFLSRPDHERVPSELMTGNYWKIILDVLCKLATISCLDWHLSDEESIMSGTTSLGKKCSCFSSPLPPLLHEAGSNRPPELGHNEKSQQTRH